MDSLIIGSDIDAFINPWADWWTLKALTDPDLAFWHTDYLFYPQGVDLFYHSFSHLNTAVSLLLRPLLGPFVAYNVTILLNLALSGLAMFQLARYLTGSAWGGLMAGIVFAVSSGSLYNSAHPVLVSAWTLPGLTLYLLRAAREDSDRMAMVAGFCLFLTAAVSPLLLILAGFWLALLLPSLFLMPELPRPSVRVLITFASMSILLILPLLSPQLEAFLLGADNSFVQDPAAAITLDLATPFLPHWDFWYAFSIYIGIVPALLTVLAAWRWPDSRLWFLLLLTAWLVAIGPQPTLMREPLPITLPWSIPITWVLRNSYRMVILIGFALAILSAYGWTVIGRRLSTFQRALLAILAATLIYVESLAATFPVTAPRVSGFYTDYLDAVPDSVALLQLPHGRQEDKHYLYYQTFHEHPIAGGVISRPSAGVTDFLASNPLARAGFTESAAVEPLPLPAQPAEALADLAEAGIGYLVLDKQLMEAAELIEWRMALPMEPVYEDELVVAYEIASQDESGSLRR